MVISGSAEWCLLTKVKAPECAYACNVIYVFVS